jgi:hypothetical protein
MRNSRHERAKLAVYKPYERMRKRWQSLVDATGALTDSQLLDDEAAMNAQQKRVERREICDVCKKGGPRFKRRRSPKTGLC